MRAAYKPAPKNAHAVRVAQSWLRAVGIQSSTPAHADLVIRCVDGSPLQVAFVASWEEASEDCLSILSADMASPKREVALEAFAVLTEEAGYGRPIPVDRGEKAHVYGDDFFLVVARHTEFHRSPNLQPAQVARYHPIVLRETKFFYAKNRNLLRLHLHDVDDLLTYAWVWTHIFAHSSEVATPTQSLRDDNERLLTKHLRDQFFHMFLKFVEASRSQTPDVDTVHIALRGMVIDENHQTEKIAFDPRETPFSDADDTPEISATRRRKAATEILRRNLALLPHDVMVERLHEQAACAQRDYATSREARRLLQKHAKTCSVCEAAGVIDRLPELGNRG